MLIYISFVDIDTLEISNLSVIILLLLNVLYAVLTNDLKIELLYKLILNGIITSLLILSIYIVSREKAMGFGDVLLSFVVGINFRLSNAILFNFLAFVIGGIISTIILLNKKKGLKAQVPFGPMISISAFITLLYGDMIIIWYLNMYK